METRSELQRLLEDMDKMIRRKQQELSELDERLEVARARVSESEAHELLKQQQRDISDPDESATADQRDRANFEEALREQRNHYEQQIARLTEELVELESANQQLIKLNNRLRADCDSTRALGEQLKARMQLLDESLEEARGANFELNIRLAKAESESQMQQRLLKKSHQQDQLLMDAFNSKLESLRRTIGERELEIGRLRADNQLTLESLGIRLDLAEGEQEGEQDSRLPEAFHAQTSDGLIDSGNKQRIIQIANLIRERDAQIELLKDQLVQMTNELESNTRLLQQLTSERRAEQKSRLGQNGDTSVAPNGCDESQQSLAGKCRMLETELEVKDEQLNRIEWRNRQLELVLPVAVAETIEKLKLALRRADWPGQQAHAKPSCELDEDDKNFKLLVADLAEQLAELLARFESGQTMLMAVEQQQLVIKNKDAQIRRLVRELNRLSAEINRDQIDLPDERDIGMGAEQLPGTRREFINRSDRAIEEAKVSDQQTSADSITEQESRPTHSSGGRMGHNRRLEASGNNDDPISLEQQQVAGRSTGDTEAAAQLPSSNLRECSPTNDRPHTSRPRGRVGRKMSSKRNLIARGFVAGNKRRATAAKTRSFVKFAQKLDSQSEQPASSSPGATSVLKMDQVGRAAADQSASGDSLASRQLERALELQGRLREVENENQLLELAMKEILLAIKWSDARCSSLLIDCPSLERLCQLIEARFITAGSGQLPLGGPAALSSGQLANSRRALDSKPPVGLPPNRAATCDLFQFVVLKSELDLIRGQNEQLRSDLKLQRREFLERPIVAESGIEPESEESKLRADAQDADCPPEESLGFSEAEIQTDSCIQIADVIDGQLTDKREDKCRKCPRLMELAHHLLDCIVRIESRVSASDESNIKRLAALYQLTQRLEQDVKSREQLLARRQRDLDAMTQQKLFAESKTRLLESQLEVHSKLCPLSAMSQPLAMPMRHKLAKSEPMSPSGTKLLPTNAKQIQIYTATSQSHVGQRCISTFSMQDGRKRYVERAGVDQICRDNQAMIELTKQINGSEQRKRASNKVTVALLQSIIACLQARLDYKDERLNQLEQMLADEAAG